MNQYDFYNEGVGFDSIREQQEAQGLNYTTTVEQGKGVVVSPNPNKSIKTTYAELKSKRDNGELVPGTWYRITDYQCTTTQENTSAATHNFDIVVNAIDEHTLNENAFAATHEGDTYFSGCNLSAWELKYTLDNDKAKHSWADENNGKGIVYYMKDEWNNECPYDFKNIMFKRWAVSAVTNDDLSQEALESLNDAFVYNRDVSNWRTRFGIKGSNYTEGKTEFEIGASDFGWYYTFSTTPYDVDSNEYLNDDIEDASIMGNNFYNDEQGGGCYGNVLKPYMDNMASDDEGIDGWQVLNNIVFNGYYETNTSEDCVYAYHCFGNSIGFKSFDNTFGNNCYGNTFGNDFDSNTFGNNCYYNTFGNNFVSNTFGNNCYYNTFGNNCYGNTFGNDCYSNTFGNSVGYNTFGNSVGYNTFGNYVRNNTFGNYMRQLTVFDGVIYCNVTSGDSSSSYVQNAQILNGTKGSGKSNKLTITFVQNSNDVQFAGLMNGSLKKWGLKDIPFSVQ